MTIRSANTLRTVNYVAGQAAKSIGSDDHRDFVDSAESWAGPAFATLVSSAAITWATAGEKRNNALLTLAHNATLSITGAVAGAQGYLEVTQDGTGGHTLALPAGKIVGATVSINATAGKLTCIAWSYNGTSFRFVLAQEA